MTGAPPPRRCPKRCPLLPQTPECHGPQSPAVMPGAAAWGTEQDDNIPGSNRTQVLPWRIMAGSPAKGLNSFRHKLGFGLIFHRRLSPALASAGCRGAPPHSEEGDGGGSPPQGFRLPILQSAHRSGHGAPKYVVGRLQNFTAGPKILRQENFPPLPRLCLPRPEQIPGISPGKFPGPPDGTDKWTALHLPPGSSCPRSRVSVSKIRSWTSLIPIFIHHHFPEPPPNSPGGPGWAVTQLPRSSSRSGAPGPRNPAPGGGVFPLIDPCEVPNQLHQTLQGQMGLVQVSQQSLGIHRKGGLASF